MAGFLTGRPGAAEDAAVPKQPGPTEFQKQLRKKKPKTSKKKSTLTGTSAVTTKSNGTGGFS